MALYHLGKFFHLARKFAASFAIAAHRYHSDDWQPDLRRLDQCDIATNDAVIFKVSDAVHQGNRAKNFWTIRASSESSKPLIRQSEDCGGEFG
jgi:hypothetical protein